MPANCVRSDKLGKDKGEPGKWGRTRRPKMSSRKESKMKIITCEQVSNGHPDKICDQIADAIVTDCLQHDKNSRVAIEVLIKDSHIIIAGELTSTHKPDYRKLVYEVFERIGFDRVAGMQFDPLYAGPDIGILVKEQSADIALGVDRGGAGDQGMMYGYATNETAELLPIPFVVATRFLEILKNHPSKMFRADAKAQVSFDYDTGKITTFLCSVQHSPDVEPADFRHIIEGIMVLAACENGLNTDFEKLVNPTGRFVIGGSYADCGVTGRKLACDTYGGVGHIGGGAMSGKDPSKVDVAEPVSVYVETFGTEHQDRRFIEQYVRENYDLTPRGIIQKLGLLDVDYNLVSAYGHFGKKGLPWEQ